jgi:hypothetical protein
MNTFFGILLIGFGLFVPILGCGVIDIVDDECPNSTLPVGIMITIAAVMTLCITFGLHLLGVK